MHCATVWTCWLLAVSLGLLLLGSSASAQEQADRALQQELQRYLDLRELAQRRRVLDLRLQQELQRYVDLREAVDPQTPLRDTLRSLADKYDVSITIDQDAFKAKGV